MSSIESLPVEILIEILVQIDGFTLGKCRRVCKNWKIIIDETDYFWEKICLRECRYPAKIARKKASKDLRWSHIYKNLVMWSNVQGIEKEFKQFYVFLHNDINHALEVEYGVLPLKETRGVLLYDASTLKLIPVAVPEQNVIKIANNNLATVILLSSGLLIQKTVEDYSDMSEAFFKAQLCVLSSDEVYFCDGKSIYSCDLRLKTLGRMLITHIEYNITQMQYNDDTIYIFTQCGKILTITRDHKMHTKPINCPREWVAQIKRIAAVNATNFICYSSTLFKIETDKYQHLYLDFPSITALFFYIDFVIIGTRQGEILLYRLASQKKGMKPIFEKFAQLPDKKYALRIDVCERESGPVIIVSTLIDIMIIEMTFFPHEIEKKQPYPPHVLAMFKRLSILRDRLRMGVPSMKAIA